MISHYLSQSLLILMMTIRKKPHIFAENAPANIHNTGKAAYTTSSIR